MSDAEATVARLAPLYEAAGPRISCTLVEANALLVLADLRASTNIVLFEPTDQDEQTIAALTSDDLRISLGRRQGVILLQSLEGMPMSRRRRVCAACRLSRLPSWEGLRPWMQDALDALRTHYEPEPILWDRYIGLLLVYPDIAVDDLCQAMAQGRSTHDFAEADLPLVARYGGSQPIFHYAPEHVGDPGIAETIATWTELLEGVYASTWHQLLAADPAFKAARRAQH